MKLESIWLLHHSHTDIGFTLDQPVLWEMERRFIDTAIDACERHADHDGDHAFKWVVETVAPLLYWLEHSSDRQIARFQALEKAGRIEIAGSFLNVVPLADADDYAEMFQPLARLRRDYGFTIRHAMNADVNGHNWTLVDAMLGAGLETFSMAINVHYGGAPFERPGLFHWKGPSGRAIPTLNNWCYPVAGWCGIPTDEKVLTAHVPQIEAMLDKAGWPLPFVLLQAMAYGGDNSTADIEFSEFIRKWNAKGSGPRLRMVTWREFWAAAKPVLAGLSVHAGDWTDYWNFGALSSAKETALARRARSRLRTADLLHASLEGLGVGRGNDVGADRPGRAPEVVLHTAPEYRRQAWQDLETWHEHTWGSFAAGDPEAENSGAAWHHKAKLAWQAHSLSLLLARDGVAELAIRAAREPEDALVLFNPLPWARTVWGDGIPAGCLADPDATHHRSADSSATRHGQDIPSQPEFRVGPVTVPACGYTAVPKSLLYQTCWPWERKGSDTPVVEDNLRRIEFDTATGGIRSWFDKTLGRDLVDRSSPWRFGSVVHEEVRRPEKYDGSPRGKQYGAIEYGLDKDKPVWKPDWQANRRSHVKVQKHMVIEWPDAIEVEQVVEVPGLASPATLLFILPRHENTLEVRANWHMSLETYPESTYLALPFDAPGATVRYDVGGVGIEPERQQLPGTCRDYFHLQNWADFSGAGFGVTIATPDNPLVQFGDFHFAHAQKHFSLERALFLGWITSNYWCTNFPGHQAGQVAARYVLRPYAGGFDETAAHRFGLEVAVPCLPQNAREAMRPQATLPRSGSLLALPALPVMVQHVLPAAWSGAGTGRGLLLRLINASDLTQTATVGSGVLKVMTAARCDLFGNDMARVPVKRGAVSVELAPREQLTLRLVTRKG